MTSHDVAPRAPDMLLEDFFLGRTQAWGIFQDRFGKLRQQFTVDIQGDWDPGSRVLKLTEDFTYHDGRRERRVWTITKLDDTRYSGHTDEVVGMADVRVHGHAVNLSYRMKVDIAGKHWTLTFDDWMFRQDRDVVINRAQVSKLGLLVGTATICFRKATANEGPLAAPGAVPHQVQS